MGRRENHVEHVRTGNSLRAALLRFMDVHQTAVYKFPKMGVESENDRQSHTFPPIPFWKLPGCGCDRRY